MYVAFDMCMMVEHTLLKTGNIFVFCTSTCMLQKVDARKTNSEFNEKMKREENEKTGGERWKWKLFVRNQDSQSHQSFNKILEPIVSLSSKHDSTSFWDGLHSILSLPFYRLQK